MRCLLRARGPEFKEGGEELIRTREAIYEKTQQNATVGGAIGAVVAQVMVRSSPTSLSMQFAPLSLDARLPQELVA